jgi:ATP-dependent helicase HrpA
MTHSNLPNPTDLHACLLADRAGLRRRWRALRQRLDRGQPIAEGLAWLWREIEASRAILEQRRALVSKI